MSDEARQAVPLGAGALVVYRCLAGFRYDAQIRVARLDGRVDLAVDAGCNDPVELTRIEVVERDKLRPGTCCERGESNAEGTAKAGHENYRA